MRRLRCASAGRVTSSFNVCRADVHNSINNKAAAGVRGTRAFGAECKAAAAHVRQLLISHIGTTMARGHAQLLPERLQCATSLPSQRAHHRPSAAASSLLGPLSRRCCGCIAACASSPMVGRAELRMTTACLYDDRRSLTLAILTICSFHTQMHADASPAFLSNPGRASDRLK